LKLNADDDHADSPAIVDLPPPENTAIRDFRPELRPDFDATETALTTALTAATIAQDFDTVKTIVEELRARRLTREGVADLAGERRRRGR
jgi:hypothetical protein